MKCVRNSPLRVLVSAALLIAVIYFIRSRQAPAPVSNAPFLSEAPSAEGTGRFAWVPKFLGVELEDIHSSLSHSQLSYAYSFKTEETAKNIVAFYETRLRAIGFTVVIKDLGGLGAELHAENPDRKRIIDVKAASAAKYAKAASAKTSTAVGVAAVER